jgi:hypothetical protein
MDSEAAVLRSKISQTRAELDYKISQLQRRKEQMTPTAVARRMLPERVLDYAIGTVLTIVGSVMALKRIRARA